VQEKQILPKLVISSWLFHFLKLKITFIFLCFFIFAAFIPGKRTGSPEERLVKCKPAADDKTPIGKIFLLHKKSRLHLFSSVHEIVIKTSLRRHEQNINFKTEVLGSVPVWADKEQVENK